MHVLLKKKKKKIPKLNSNRLRFKTCKIAKWTLNAILPRGKQGKQGIQGRKGVTGPEGSPGEVGEQGLQGEWGSSKNCDKC